MAIEIIANQSLGFNLVDSPGGCNNRYFLPVQRGDQINLQGISTQIPILNPISSNRVTNGDFSSGGGWTLGAGFAISSGHLEYTGNASVTSAVSNDLRMKPKGLYQFSCEVLVTDPGTCTAFQGVIVKLGGVELKLPNVPLTSGAHESFSIVAFYTSAGGAAITDNHVEFTINNTSIRFQVDNVKIHQFSNPIINAYAIDGTFIEEIIPITGFLTNGIFYLRQPDYQRLYTDVTECRFDLNFLLDALPDGCCYIEIIDGYADVLNGSFLDTSAWTLGTGWSISNDTAIGTDNQVTSNLLQNIQMYGGSSYTVTFNVQGLDSHVGVTVYFDFSYISGGIISHNFVGSSQNGDKTFTFTAPGSSGQFSDVIFYFRPSTTFGYMGPINVVISGVTITDSSETPNQSNNISFQTAFAGTPTLLFTATNNDSAFNFDYSGGLTHQIRLAARKKYHDYPEVVEQYNFSNNANRLMVSSTEKVYEVIIGDAAEFAHDCLRMMRINDTFTISGARYIIDGGYGLKQRKSTELSVATFAVKPIDGISKNWAIN